MKVRDLLFVCEEANDREVMATIDDVKHCVNSVYIEDNTLYLSGENGCHSWTDLEIANHLIREAQDPCWYDWRNGSAFLDCEVIFVGKDGTNYEIESALKTSTFVFLHLKKIVNKLIKVHVTAEKDIVVSARTPHEAMEKAKEQLKEDGFCDSFYTFSVDEEA